MKEMNMKNNFLSYLMQAVRCFIKNKKTSTGAETNDCKAKVSIPNRFKEKNHITLKIDLKNNENFSSIGEFVKYFMEYFTEYHNMKEVYVMKLLPTMMDNFIVDGMDIRDYMGKYLSVETFKKFRKFIHEEIERTRNRKFLDYEDLYAHCSDRFGYVSCYMFTYGADNKTYIQAGKFYYIFDDTAILNVDVFNEPIY